VKTGMVQKWADSGNIGTNLTAVKKRGVLQTFFTVVPVRVTTIWNLWLCGDGPL
jgi:hypothetical protein